MKRSFLGSLPDQLRLPATTYFIGMAFFSAFRLVLLGVNWERASQVPAKTLLQALWMGIRFDTVISCYLLVPPFLLLTAMALMESRSRISYKIVFAYSWLFYTVSFFACASDIPYFNYFGSRLTVTVLTWMDTPMFVANMVLQDSSYYPYFLLFFAASGSFLVLLKRSTRMLPDPETRPHPNYRLRRGLRVAGISLLAASLLFLGIRGRVAAKSPIRWGTAFFSTDAFANQLGLNPVFTFARSWLDARRRENRPFAWMDERLALQEVRKHLGVPPTTLYDSPIARRVNASGDTLRYNVVVVLMESMAANKMGSFGNEQDLTPHLDALASTHSYLFTRFYSSGTHTFNGVYSTLFGFPALLSRHPMKTTESMQPFGGLGRVLAENGYQTIFFTTHDAQFDNMGGFLSFNGFQEIISQADYPSEQILSTLGVPDHYLFEFAVDRLNRLNEVDKPFFAALLTASDHGPHIVPEGIPFQPRSASIKQQIVEYADWSIGHFMQLAAQQPWFDRTLFVFVADHGSDPSHETDLSLHHIPLIVHSPSAIDEPRIFPDLGGQIDLGPTILGLLNIDYVNNTLGIDLLREKRPYIFFNSDDDIGCLDEEYYLFMRSTGKESLYRYVSGDPRDYLDAFPERSERMRTYAKAMLQTTQTLIRNMQVGLQRPQ